MKSLIAVLLLASLLALGQSYPGAIRESDESTDAEDRVGMLSTLLTRLKPFYGEDADDDTSVPSDPFRYSSNSFNNWFFRMQEAMDRMRAEMAARLAATLNSRLDGPWGTNLTSLGKLPGGSTTSTTKIIGNHAVAINDTTYTGGDDNVALVIRVRVIDVQPLNETAEAGSAESTEAPDSEKLDGPAKGDGLSEPTTQPPRSVESVEEFDNKVPGGNDDKLLA